MSEYEARGGDWDWRSRPGFSAQPPGPVWDGHGDPPAWMANSSGCGCAACEANGPAKRHRGEDGGRHHAPYLADDPAAGDNPYELLRRLNDARHDPWADYEDGEAEVASKYAESVRGGRDLGLELRRYRNPDGGNLSGSAARDIIRCTEFRAVP